MSFDKNKDQIAITIPYFRMRKSADGLDRWNEISIATIAVDEKGQDDKAPAVYINHLKLEHPVKSWERVDFAGSGRIVYGPAQPGSFVYCAVLFIESDSRSRDLGKLLNEVASGNDIQSIITAVAGLVNPTGQIILSLLSPISKIVAKVLESNKDNVVYTQEGIFLRDINLPYNIGDSFKRTNDYIESKIQVIPLIQERVQSRPTPMGLKKNDSVTTNNGKSDKLSIELLAGAPKKVSVEKEKAKGDKNKEAKKSKEGMMTD